MAPQEHDPVPPFKSVLRRRETDIDMEVRALHMPLSWVEPFAVAYRSTGIGLFGVLMRFAGMPLEKIALFMNSSQVSGERQFQKAVRLTFQDGYLGPYRVVGPASIAAWFLQYSVMGCAFQFFDHGLSNLLGVRPVYYGTELMQPPPETKEASGPLDYQVKSAFKTLLAPILSASFESKVSNRAEVQRYFGPKHFRAVSSKLQVNALRRAVGPAFLPNVTRNMIMCQTSFVLTPITYKLYFPQERKSQSTIFWYGLGLNVFVGNVMAITQQALWGRTLDYAAKHGTIRYRTIIQEGFEKDGLRAFFTTSKWFSRVLMNAPAQGSLPWFYNEVLPLGERPFLDLVKTWVYEPLMGRQTKHATDELITTTTDPFAQQSNSRRRLQ